MNNSREDEVTDQQCSCEELETPVCRGPPTGGELPPQLPATPHTCDGKCVTSLLKYCPTICECRTHSYQMLSPPPWMPLPLTNYGHTSPWRSYFLRLACWHRSQTSFINTEHPSIQNIIKVTHYSAEVKLLLLLAVVCRQFCRTNDLRVPVLGQCVVGIAAQYISKSHCCVSRLSARG